MTDKNLLNNLTEQNMTTHLEQEALKQGTENQRERWLHKVLPEEEILQLARKELFRWLDDVPRWASGDGRKDMRSAMRHDRDCVRETASGGVRNVLFEVLGSCEMNAKEWALLKHLRELADATRLHPWLTCSSGSVKVDMCTHWAECSECYAEEIRHVAKVSITWAGRVLVREYLLS